MTTTEAAERLGYASSGDGNDGRNIRYLAKTGRLRVSKSSTPHRLDISEEEVQDAIARRWKAGGKWRYPVVVQ